MKRTILIMACVLGCFCYSGCSSKDTEHEIVKIVDETEENKQKNQNKESSSSEEDSCGVPEVNEKSEKYMAVIRTSESEEYREVELEKGKKIDPLMKQGYIFDGYEGENGIKYVNKNGEVEKDYHGSKQLILHPIFIPEEYEIIICQEGKPLERFNRILCNFEANMGPDLPFGRVIESENDKVRDKVVIGFADEKFQEIKFDEEIISPRSLMKNNNQIDYENKKIYLNVITTDIEFLSLRLDSYEICNDGFREQKLGKDNKQYDVFDMSEDVDLNSLKKLGYNEVVVEFTTILNPRDGDPCIRVLSKKAKKEDDLEKNIIFDLDETILSKENEYKFQKKIPIKKLTDAVYVYYDSDTLFDSKWISNECTIKINFLKNK